MSAQSPAGSERMMHTSLSDRTTAGLAMKGILLALSGFAVWILSTAGTAYYRAIAASCGDGHCSQTAGSDAAFVADVGVVVSYIGIGIWVTGLVMTLAALLFRKRAIVGNR